MQPDTTTPAEPEKLAPQELSHHFRGQLAAFLAPLLTELDARIDLRLVRTFLVTVEAILSFRHRNHGLLLSELGAYLLSPAQAPPGPSGSRTSLASLLTAPLRLPP